MFPYKEPVKQVLEPPYSSVGLVYTRWPTGLGQGSGFVVGKNLLMTAAHVVYNPLRGGKTLCFGENEPSGDALYFFLPHQGYLGVAIASEIFPADEYVKTCDTMVQGKKWPPADNKLTSKQLNELRKSDWALCRLRWSRIDKPLTACMPPPIATITVVESHRVRKPILRTRTVRHIGYPAETSDPRIPTTGNFKDIVRVAQQRQMYEILSSPTLSGKRLEMNGEMMHGSSGGPWLFEERGRYCAVGVQAQTSLEWYEQKQYSPAFDGAVLAKVNQLSGGWV